MTTNIQQSQLYNELFIKTFKMSGEITLPSLTPRKKGSPYSTAQHRVMELIPVLGR